MVGTKTNLSTRHQRLGQPSLQILQSLVRESILPCQSLKFNKFCIACSCNKIHKLIFDIFNLQSSKPLEFMYIDVCGPFKVVSKEGFKCYVSFVDRSFIWSVAV